MFVSWVSKEAGTPLKGDDVTTPWRITNARKIAKYLQANGTWFSKKDAARNNIQPQVGDIMVFWRGDYEGNLGHADIVVGVNPKIPGHASLIGGNLKEKVMYRESYYYADHYGLLGFGRPEKQITESSSDNNVTPENDPKIITESKKIDIYKLPRIAPLFSLKP